MCAIITFIHLYFKASLKLSPPSSHHCSVGSLPRRPPRPGGRASGGAAAGEHRPSAAAPPAGQPPRRQLPVPQTAAETGRPEGAGHRARSVGAGHQENRGRVASPAPAGDIQGHVLRRC